MTFAPVFQRVFQPSFDRRNAGGAWWNLFGAIPLANCVAAYQAKGAVDLAASYINLANPGTYNLTTVSAPTWDVTNGWIFNGSKDLTSGVLLNGNTWSVVVRCSNITGAGTLFGVRSTSGSTMVFQCNGGSTTGINWRLTLGGAGTVVPPNFSGGVAGMVAGVGGYRDGISEISLGTVNVTSAVGCGIGCRNNNGTADDKLSGNIQAIAFYNNNQAANMAALTTAINAL